MEGAILYIPHENKQNKQTIIGVKNRCISILMITLLYYFKYFYTTHRIIIMRAVVAAEAVGVGVEA